MSGEFGVSWCHPSSCSQLLCCGLMGDKRLNKLWKATILACFWANWSERNSRIFDEKSSLCDFIWERIKFWVATWVYRTKGFEGLSFLDLSREWKSFLVV